MRLLRRISKILIYSMLTFLMLFSIVAVAIRYPSVQTWLTKKAATTLSEKLGTKVTVGGVDFDFFKTAVLEDIYVEDQHQDTLLYAGRLGMDIGVFKLLQSEIFLNKVKLESSFIDLHRLTTDSVFNYQFIIDTFSNDQPTDSTATSFKFGIGKVVLEQVRFNMRDEGNGRFDLQANIDEWEITADELDFANQKIALGDVALSNSEVIFRQLEKDSTNVAPPTQTASLTFPGIGWTITANAIRLENNHLVFADDNTSVSETALDFSHLDLQGLNLSIDNFQYADKGILGEINGASFKDKNGFMLEELKGKVSILPTGISAEGFVFKTPQSSLSNNTRLVFNEFNDLSDFLGKVKLESEFYLSTLAFSDLLMVAPALRDIKNLRFPEGETLQIAGGIFTENNQLTVEDFAISLGNDTQLEVTGSISQLTDDPVYSLNLKKLTTSYRSLERYTKGLGLPPSLENFGRFSLSGNVAGTLADLQADDLVLTTEAATRFSGDLKMVGLPDLSKTVFDLKIKDLATRSSDLKGFSKNPLLPELDSLGLVQFTGHYKGTTRKFTVDGNFHTSAGSATTDLNMDFNEGYSDAVYSGKLAIEKFDLGKILADTSKFGLATLSADLNGRGLTLDSLDTKVVGVVQSAVFNKYDYKDLKVDGHFVQRLFQGQMNMQDENLIFGLQGKVNLNDSLPEIDAIVQLDTINLKNLNFYGENLGIRGRIEANIKGNHLDNLDGKAILSNLAIASDNEKYFDKKIVLEAKQLRDGKRALVFNANFLNANVEGDFNFGDLPDLVLNYVNDFFPMEGLADSTFNESPITADQAFTFDFQFKDITSLTSVFLPDLQEMDTTAFLHGNFDSKEKQLELTAVFPKLSYQGSTLDSVILKINGNRKRLRSDVALRNLNFNNTFYAPFFDLNTRIGADTLRFDLAVKNDSLQHLFKWGGKSTELPDVYQLVFDKVMVLNQEDWDISPNNSINFNRNTLSIKDLIFEKDNQSIAINSQGTTPSDDIAPLEIRFDNFNLSEISALLNNPNLQLTGATNGQFTVIEPKQNLHYNADVRVADMTLNSQPLGQFSLEASQPPGKQIINIAAKLEGDNNLSLQGSYDVPANQFDVKADFDQLGIVVVDPFLTGLMRDSRGFVSGNFTLKGTPDKPLLLGNLTTHDVSTEVVLTGTRYRLDGNTISISENKIDLGEVSVFDKSNRKATISGEITHAFFDQIKFDLRAKTDGLKVLNTTRQDNPLYYGNLFASADVRITGSPELPKLNVVATTLDSSLLHVEPLVSELAVVQEDYVIFANPNDYEPDSLSLLEQQVGTKLGGFDLTLTLIVTPAAQLNIIIDPLTGDELFCTGNGNFTVLMNPSGDLNITGTYVIEKGNYSFAYEGLVKRDFEIRKGSSLSFAGDPYNARFDITAVYKTRATTYELISNEATLDDATSASSQRRSDVEVLLNIDGNLTEPVITFDIALPNSQGGLVDNLVARKLADLRDEPTELNKQVFGLLFFNSFIQSETGAGLANVGENVALKSVSGLISNQLNRLADRFIKGVDLTLGFDSYKTGGQETSTVSELQVGLSKRLFDNRLTIQVGGNFNLENSQQSQVQEGAYTAIAGDFLLEYKLNERGNYLVKVFHKSDYNILLGNTNKTGVGLIYRKSY